VRRGQPVNQAQRCGVPQVLYAGDVAEAHLAAVILIAAVVLLQPTICRLYGTGDECAGSQAIDRADDQVERIDKVAGMHHRQAQAVLHPLGQHLAFGPAHVDVAGAEQRTTDVLRFDHVAVDQPQVPLLHALFARG